MSSVLKRRIQPGTGNHAERAQLFAALYLPPRLAPADTPAADALVAVASEFSPRIERHGDAMVVADISGVGRLFGTAREVGDALRCTAADRGLATHVAIAATRTAARLLAQARAGVTIVEVGQEAQAVAALPLRALEEMGNGPFRILKRWGLKTLGDLAALPAADLRARLGAEGVALQTLARGEDAAPLVPLVPDEPFEASLELEWPINGFEPLSFVLGRLCDTLAIRLERRDRGAAVLHARFRLVTRDTLERTLQLPAPMRDPRVLRTLILLDLESYLSGIREESRIPNPDSRILNPESRILPTGIDAVTVAIDPAPGPVVQFSLLERAMPSPEALSTLTARLSALIGEGRVGAPALVDSHRPEAFAMKRFITRNGERETRDASLKRDSAIDIPRSTFVPPSAIRGPHCVLRRFRHPVPIRLAVEHGRPVRLVSWRRGIAGGRIAQAAGPWRTSGEWWNSGAWDRDEWDVAIADGTIYRIHLDRALDRWFIEGVMD